MRLLVAKEQPVIPGAELDVRDEVMAQIFDRGDPVPKRTLTFTIEVTDEGKTSGSPFRLRRTFRNWRRIGTLVFDNAVVSYNGDAVIHFSHPTWREDRNDPATATRQQREGQVSPCGLRACGTTGNAPELEVRPPLLHRAEAGRPACERGRRKSARNRLNSVRRPRRRTRGRRSSFDRLELRFAPSA
jgi:hypothetical protein